MKNLFNHFEEIEDCIGLIVAIAATYGFFYLLSVLLSKGAF